MAVFLGLDFGLRWLGVAVGNDWTGSAAPLEGWALHWKQAGTLLAPDSERRLLALQARWQPSRGVVGRPLHMDGRPFWITSCAEAFALTLGQLWSIPIDLQDERLTTVEARAERFEREGFRGLTKSRVDAQAAALILNDYLRGVQALESSRNLASNGSD